MKSLRKFANWMYAITGVFVVSLEGADALKQKNFKRAQEILEEREKIWPNDPLILELKLLCAEELLETKRHNYAHEDKMIEQGLAAHQNGIHGNA